jgi:hypothetical protein
MEKNGAHRGGSIWPFIMPPLLKDAGTTEEERNRHPPLTATADAYPLAAPRTRLESLFILRHPPPPKNQTESSLCDL